MVVKEQDEKSNNLRELLSSFYGSGSSDSESRFEPPDALQGIDLPNFDSDRYISSLDQHTPISATLFSFPFVLKCCRVDFVLVLYTQLVKTPLDRLRDRHVEMAAEIKTLDSDIQFLVYENYNKFISATDTIRRMKENVSGMELEMDQLLKMVTIVRGESDGVNASLCKRRERIEELNRTRSLLRQIQFAFSLPHRLRKCINTENYVGAAKYYYGSLPILKAYGQSSFRKCKEESDAIISTLIKRLQAKIKDRSVLLPARAQAVSLLQQLKHPALETSTSRKELHTEDEKDFIQEFLDESVKFREIFPNGEDHLLHISTEFFDDYFKTVNLSLQPDSGEMLAAELNISFRQLLLDVSRMNELFPRANLLDRASEAVENAVRKHVTKQFNCLNIRIKASLRITDLSRKPDSQQPPKTLKAFLEIAQKTIIDGSLEVLQDLKELLVKSKSYFARWADEYTDLVQGGFQELFTNLIDHFGFLCAQSVETPPQSDESQSAQTVTPSLILLLSLLSIYLYQTAVPQITELVGTWFPGGGAMGSEGRPAFVPSEICRFLNTTGEKLLQQYVDVQARNCSVVVRKAVNTPNWLEVIFYVLEFSVQRAKQHPFVFRPTLARSGKDSSRRTAITTSRAHPCLPTQDYFWQRRTISKCFRKARWSSLCLQSSQSAKPITGEGCGETAYRES
ncbi:vacuolar protein sorting-associated protein 51 homolog isoform X3 [Physcomitrium patens]|uniref:Vacuolar protein sorting-associated protein 51 homolog n=1 Tax=Physcomitrium patens TaxID=3218 RepID=A0A7I4DM38_PHYPA|nr:vacuolar protein sorting-associated protein 51 homolog isoform X4 [Physcomitrium patens]|eukprot:XP_024371443.1 vacuolar protein sorting-associated protein 51 homolog isoform X4 [Physcomitrella patens]